MILGKGVNVDYDHIFFMRPNDRGGTSVGYKIDGQERWYESPVSHDELRMRYVEEAREYLDAHPISRK